MAEDGRQPDESELDYQHRLKRASDGERLGRLRERIQKYQPATGQIARKLAEPVEKALAEIVGPTTISFRDTDIACVKGFHDGAVTHATIKSASKLGPESVDVMLSVYSTMAGPETPEEMAYTVSATYESTGGKNRAFRVDMPLDKAAIQRPIIAENTFRGNIRKLLGLEPLT